MRLGKVGRTGRAGGRQSGPAAVPSATGAASLSGGPNTQTGSMSYLPCSYCTSEKQTVHHSPHSIGRELLRELVFKISY